MTHARGRAARLGGLLVVLCLSGLALNTTGSTAVAVDAGGSDSAVTKSGTGAFAGLQVTVGQTGDLVNQVVPVSWTGGAPTQSPGNFDINFLQIMQCWSRSTTEQPDRTTCQFGGLNVASANGYTYRRQLTYGRTLVDPKEPAAVSDPPDGKIVNVPFTPVGDQTGPQSRFFDNNGSNEIPFARTRADGTGVAYLEAQNAQQAPGLGCGQPQRVTSGTYTPACWLVVVPRGDREVDGSKRDPSSSLLSSPLSQTNWDQRIVFPLQFQPTALTCPLSAAERQLVGQETFTQAISQWQPTLCGGGGAVFNYSQVSDDVARRVLVSPQPGLDFLSRPLSADQLPDDGPAVYAPVALSALTFAINIDKAYTLAATPAEVAQAGQRVSSMNLTPRVVAKLLTQSYQFGAQYDGKPEDELKNNASSLIVDPDFLKDNPDFAHVLPSVADALVPFAPADAFVELWAWINADPDARGFLEGKPDPSGMTVNPSYKNLDMGLDRLPKSDLRCRIATPAVPVPYCTLDDHPYTNDFRDAARSASRGDSLKRDVINPASIKGQPATLSKRSPQPQGSRALLALADAATAARYSLPTARLRNASGKFVSPDSAGLLAGLAAMKPSEVNGVLTQDPATTNPDAYPLTTLTYAATRPAKLTSSQGHDYGGLLRYAASEGQVPGVAPGQLPAGYVPLPQAQRQQTVAAAKVIEDSAGLPVAAPTTPGSTDGTSPPTAAALTGGAGGASSLAAVATAPSRSPGQPGATLVRGTTSPTRAGTAAAPGAPPTGGTGVAAGPGAAAAPPAPTSTPAATPSGQATPSAPSPGPLPSVALRALRTPGVAAGAARYLVLVTLALSLAALAGGLLLVRRSRRPPVAA